MGVGSAGSPLVRRGVVLLLGLILTVCAAFLLHTRAPYHYQATARMLLVLPAEARRELGSPFLDLPNGLVVLSTVVAEAPRSGEWRAQMRAEGLVSEFEVGLDPSTATISVSVEGQDAQNVVRTRDWLVTEIEAELLEVQRDAGAPSRQTARALLFSAHDVPDLVSGDRTRAVAAIIAGGALATVILSDVVARSVWPRRRTATGAAT